MVGIINLIFWEALDEVELLLTHYVMEDTALYL